MSSTGAFVLVVAMAVIAIRRRSSTSRRLRLVRGRIERDVSSSSTPTTQSSERLSVLCCGKCGAPVPLTAQETVACPFCGTSVAVPTQYAALLRGRDQVAQPTRDEAKALRRALVATHPALALVVVVGSAMAIASGVVMLASG